MFGEKNLGNSVEDGVKDRGGMCSKAFLKDTHQIQLHINTIKHTLQLRVSLMRFPGIHKTSSEQPDCGRVLNKHFLQQKSITKVLKWMWCRTGTGIWGYSKTRIFIQTNHTVTSFHLGIDAVKTHCVLWRTVLARTGLVSIDAVTSEVSRERYQMAEASDTDTSLLLVTW